MWGSARFGVFSKSPATGGYGESYCRGTLPERLKGCGIDAVVISASCSSLTHLIIDEGGVAFHDAGDLARRDTVYAEDVSVMTIGPAGEKLVRFACIKCDRWRKPEAAPTAFSDARSIQQLNKAGSKA